MTVQLDPGAASDFRVESLRRTSEGGLPRPAATGTVCTVAGDRFVTVTGPWRRSGGVAAMTVLLPMPVALHHRDWQAEYSDACTHSESGVATRMN